MAYPEDDIIIFDNEANFAALDTPEGALYSNGLYSELISGFDNLGQGWDVYGIVEVGPGVFEQGEVPNDVAAGGLGRDTLLGERGDDILYGGTGVNLDLDNTQALLDTALPRPGDPSVGDDLDFHSFDGFVIADFDARDNFNAPFSRYDRAGDELDGGVGNDTIFGQLGRDTLSGGSGEDWLFGGRHSDEMDGGTGADEMFGEKGLDTMLGGEEGQLFGPWTFNSTYGQSHNPALYSEGDFMAGGRGRDLMDGQSGWDTMYGNQCADTMYGGIGYDLMYGGRGGDLMRGDDDQDNDTGDGLGCFFANIESCDHRIGYSGNGDSMFGGNGRDEMYGGIGDDLMKGNAGNDTMFGEEDDDRMYGNAGDDSMSGGEGCDDLYGGTGNDTMEGNSGWDFMKGNSGDDVMDGGDGDDDMLGGFGNDTMSGGNGNDTMEGNAGNDDMFGENGNDWMFGGAGADEMEGGDGSDIMCGDEDNDTMFGGEGNDQVHGGSGNDRLFGGDGNDFINGGEGDDTMLGGDGDDVIWFQDADLENNSPYEDGLYEIAVGGNGADTFVYNFQYPGDPIVDAPGDGEDVVEGPPVTDFSIGSSGWVYITDFSTEDTLQLCLNGDISGLECDFSRIDDDGVYDSGDLKIVNNQIINRLFDTDVAGSDGQSPVTLHDNGVDTWIIFDNTAGPGQDFSDPEDLIDAGIWLQGVSGVTSESGVEWASITDMIADGYDVKVKADLDTPPEDLAPGYNYSGPNGFLQNYYAQFVPCEVECPEPTCRFDDPFVNGSTDDA